MTTNIEPSIQAWALLHGHTYIDPYQVHEQVVFNGHNHVVHPIGAALVMLPFVAAFGLPAMLWVQQWVSIAAGAMSVWLAHRLTRNWWLTTGFALGTTVLYEASRGAVWDFLLTLTLIPTICVLLELEGKRRPWVVGLLAGATFLVRNDFALALPIYWALLLQP